MVERKPIPLMIVTQQEANEQEQEQENLTTVVYRTPKIDGDINKSIAQHNFDSYSYTEKNGYHKIMMRKGDRVATLESTISPNGTYTTATDYQVPPKKSDYINDILKLQKKGIPQAQIAEILGISQSYVSKLVRQYMSNNVEEEN